MRIGEVSRKTTETQIEIKLNLDGKGDCKADTGIGFLNHMLELMTRYARFDLTVTAKGDLDVDYHHTVEDVGIALGKAIYDALGDMRGIARYGSFTLPMDESLVLVALDFSGREYLNYGLDGLSEKTGEFDTELIQEFLLGFCRAANATLHIKKLDGSNTHHIIEACFKCFGKVLCQATSIDSRFSGEIPSTKGLIKNL